MPVILPPVRFLNGPGLVADQNTAREAILELQQFRGGVWTAPPAVRTPGVSFNSATDHNLLRTCLLELKGALPGTAVPPLRATGNAGLVADRNTIRSVLAELQLDANPPPPDPDGPPDYLIDWDGGADNSAYLAAQMSEIKTLAAQIAGPTRQLRVGIKAGSFLMNRSWTFAGVRGNPMRWIDFDLTGAHTYATTDGIAQGMFTVIGDGSTKSTRRTLPFRYVEDCTVKGLKVTGAYYEAPGYVQRHLEDNRFGRFLEKYSSENIWDISTGCHRLEFTDLETVAPGADHFIVTTTKPPAGDRCTYITVRRLNGILGGRQGMAIASGGWILFEDCVVDFNGRSGFDVEPINKEDQYVNDVGLVRCGFGPWFTPFSIEGLPNDDWEAPYLPPPEITNRRMRFYLEDCYAIRGAGNRPFLSSAGGDDLHIVNMQDARNSSQFGYNIPAWKNVLIEQGSMKCGPDSDTTYLVRCENSPGPITITGTAGAGADELFLNTSPGIPATIQAAGDTITKTAHDFVSGEKVKLGNVKVPATSTAATDRIGSVGHGYVTNDKVRLSSIVGSTGIDVRVIGYWVINPTADDFQMTTIKNNPSGIANIVGDGTLMIERLDGDTPTAGLREDINYFVVTPTTDTFQVSLTSGGAAVNVTSDGTLNMLHMFILGDAGGPVTHSGNTLDGVLID